MAGELRCPKDALAMMGNVSKFSLWVLDVPHNIHQVMCPGYFNGARGNGLKTADWIMGNIASADGLTFEPVILTVQVGGEVRLPGGSVPDILVEIHSHSPRSGRSQVGRAA